MTNRAQASWGRGAVRPSRYYAVQPAGSCDVWTDPPRQVWADFVHDVDEIVMLINGEIEVSFAGKTLHPRPGEEIVIPAGASYTARNTGKTTNRVLRLPPGITEGVTTVHGTGCVVPR